MPYQTYYHHRTFFHLLALLLTSLFLHPHSSTAQKSPPSSDNYASPLPTSAVIIIVVIFVLCCLTCCIRPFFACFRAYVFGGTADGHEDDNNQLHRGETVRGLDPAVLATFTIYLVSDVKVHVDSKTMPLECAVCLNEFVDHDQLQLLPRCSHVFHPHCISPWLASHVTCPVCRANLEIQVDSQQPPQSLAQVLQQRRPREGSDPSDRIAHAYDEGDVIVHAGSSPETMVKSPMVETSNRVGERRGIFPRSHSTGHSLVEDPERYTLRLSEEVRNKLVNVNRLSGTSLPAAIASPRTRYRSRRSNSSATILGKPDHWRFTVSPPFISRPASSGTTVRGHNNNHNHYYLVEMRRSSPKSLFKSKKSPSKSPLNRRCSV